MSSAFGKWAKGQSVDDLEEEDLDEEELDGDDEEEDDEEELDGPDPEAIAGRLWSGDLSEDEIASMDKDLLAQVVDSSPEVEPDMHSAIMAIAEAVAAKDLPMFFTAYKQLMEAELHGDGGPFDAEQCVLLLDEAMERVAKGTKLDTPDGKILFAKLVSAIRSGAAGAEEEEEDELDEDLGEDEVDEAADDAALAEFDA